MKEYEIKKEPVIPGYFTPEYKNYKGEIVSESVFVQTFDPIFKEYIYYYNNGKIESKDVYTSEYTIKSGYILKQP